MACSQHHNAGKFRPPELPAGSPRAALLPIAPSAIHQYGARRELKSANRSGGCGTSCASGIVTRLAERAGFRPNLSSGDMVWFAWHGGDLRELCENSVGKPDAGNRHVRFDERARETGRSGTAPFLDSTPG